MGKLIIFSAPSGSGKTTIVKEVLKNLNNLEFSVSACSRQPRVNEIHGKDYYFISPDDFRQRIDNHEFVEWEEVYPNQYYGTLKSELERIWKKGNHVVFDVDVVGGLNIKKLYPVESIAIFVKAPSIESLKSRLQNRGTERPDQIEKRINKAQYEMGFAEKFDIVIVNDDLVIAVEKTINTVNEFINS